MARSQMGVSKNDLREDLAVGRKLKAKLRSNPVPWFAGAAVVGLLLSKLGPRRKKIEVKGPKIGKTEAKDMGKAGIAVAVLNFALQLAKPTLLRLIQDRFLGSFGSRNRRATPREARSF